MELATGDGVGKCCGGGSCLCAQANSSAGAEEDPEGLKPKNVHLVFERAQGGPGSLEHAALAPCY